MLITIIIRPPLLHLLLLILLFPFSSPSPYLGPDGVRDDDGQNEQRDRELVEERQAGEDPGGLQRRALQQRVQAKSHKAHHHAGALGQEGCRGQRARESGARPKEVTGRKGNCLK